MDNLLPTGILAHYAISWLSATTVIVLSNPTTEYHALHMLLFLQINRLLIFSITYPYSLALRQLTWKFHCLCVSGSQPQMNVNVTVL